MNYKHLKYFVCSALVGWALLLIIAFTGCVSTTASTKIHLERGQVMDFGLLTKKNDAGQHIDEYTCEPQIMVCVSHGVDMQCRCAQ